MKARLEEDFIAFAKSVVEKAGAYQVDKKIPKITYLHLPAKNINYEDNSFQYDFDQAEDVIEYKWESKELGEFVSSEIENSDEYLKALETYVATLGYEESGARMVLNTLYRHFINSVGLGRQQAELNICGYVTRLIEECQSNAKTLRCTIELWLGNVYIESDEIELAPNVYIRRVTPKQLTTIVQHGHYFEELDRFVSYVVRSTVTLSFSVETEWSISFSLNAPEIIAETDAWLNVLRLFRPCSVYVVRQISTQQSLFGYQITEVKEPPGDKYLEGKVSHNDKSVHALKLMRQDEDMLQKFAAAIKPLLKQISPTAYLSGSRLDLALHRYTDALIKSEVTANKVLSCIISLETLVSSGGSKITHTICVRIASIMHLLGYNYKEVFERMKKAYNLRSKLVHGNSLEKGNLLEFATNHGYDIINYNRVCLLAFLQLQSTIERDTLLSDLDCALIDEDLKIKIGDLFRKIQFAK